MSYSRDPLIFISQGFLLIFIVFSSFLPSAFLNAQSVDIASTHIIAGSEERVPSGDIISFEKETQSFQLAELVADKELFGIVEYDPLLVLETSEDAVPIVRTGEAFVNVTTVNGVIKAGDYITSSTIPGKGQRAGVDDKYIIGVALEPFEGNNAELPNTGGELVVGQIRVLLSIGTQDQAAAILFQEEPKPDDEDESGFSEATVLNIIQYLLAAFIAVGSIYIAFKNFSPNIKDGIISIGRNPLAKSSIQSMVILNVVLIIMISIGGLFVSIAILLLPI